MKVLLATEGSRFSNAALEECCRIFRNACDTEIRVLTVIDPTFVPAQPYAVFPTYVGVVDSVGEVTCEKTIADATERILDRLPSIGQALSSHISVGKPAQVIVDEAERWGADMIVVGSHGSGFWERTLLGSVSSAVVHHAPCSVLVVRSKD